MNSDHHSWLHALSGDLIHLRYLMEQQYTPYSKWFRSAFSQLTCGEMLEPTIQQAVRATSWHERQEALSVAYENVASMHNALIVTDPLDPTVRRFHERQYFVIDAERFASAIEAQITDDAVRSLPRRLGSLNQLLDATDKLESTGNRERFMRIYK